MEQQKSPGNKGGRPSKNKEDRASVKLNCWVTSRESEQLWSEFKLAKAGKRIPFASYLKEKLFRKGALPPAKSNELLLTILINLQERGRQLEAISEHLTSAQNSVETAEVNQRVSLELKAIQETLTHISRWLYES